MTTELPEWEREFLERQTEAEAADFDPIKDFGRTAEQFAEGLRANAKAIGDAIGSFQVRKVGYYLPVSDEVLHPERYPAPRISRRRRILYRWLELKARVGMAWAVLRGRHDCDGY